jgi:hypothetical protein
MIAANYLITYLHSKGHKAETINDSLKAYFGATVLLYPTVIFWHRKSRLKHEISAVR